MGQQLLIATRNSGKISEFREMFRELKVEWVGLTDLGLDLEVAETGTTFLENAVIKATAYATASGLLTLADDSGLEVDALHSRPGIHTARFGGPDLTPVQRYELLLEEMDGIPFEKRTARFRCVIALTYPNKFIGSADGVCEGAIAYAPSGRGGFGYDPVFFLPDKGLTMAQLPAHEKHLISHRGRAIANIKPFLDRLLGQNSVNLP